MKKIYIGLAAAVLLFLVFMSASVIVYAQSSSETGKLIRSNKYEKDLNRPLIPRGKNPGLLIAAHGSPSPGWKILTGELLEKVRKLNKEKKFFTAVELSDMEFNTENDMAAGIKRLETAGCDLLVVVPAFIYPTSHVQFDITAILGIYSSSEMRKNLKEEGIRTVRSKTPITLTPTMSSGELIADFVLAEAKSVRKDAKNERLLIIAHGDDEYKGLVNRLTQKPIEACKKLGFDRVECSFCEMGQTFGSKVKPIIEKNTHDGKKTLIVAVYLASSAQSFVKRVEKFSSVDKNNSSQGGGSAFANSLQGLNYECSSGRLGDFSGTPVWIFETARQAVLY